MIINQRHRNIEKEKITQNIQIYKRSSVENFGETSHGGGDNDLLLKSLVVDGERMRPGRFYALVFRYCSFRGKERVSAR